MSIAAETRRASPSSGASSSAPSSPALPALLTGEVQREPASRPGHGSSLRPRAIVPKTLDEVLGFARAVVAARMAPTGLDTPEACMIAILHGLEVGLTPLSALQRIAVIGGRPTIWGDGAMALVRASGLAAAIDERIEGTGPADWVAVCTVRRRGEPLPVERRFSVDDARRARLWGRPGPWSDYPRRMLQMRARAFALRDVFADVLGGLYLREEIEGVEAVEFPERDEASGNGDGWTPTSAREDAAPAEPAPPVSPGLVQPQEPTSPSRREGSARPRIVAPPPPGWPAPTAEALSQSEATSAKAAQADDVVADDDAGRGQPTPPPLPALTRRRTASAREAQRLRYAQGWAVRRPRTLQPRRPAPQPARRSPSDPVAAETTALDTPPAPASHGDVTLFDDALSCARDWASLDEIVQEFAPRLSRAGREIRAAAARALKRHRQRVTELERQGAIPAWAQQDGDGELEPGCGATVYDNAGGEG